jgi:hypothetical protein
MDIVRSALSIEHVRVVMTLDRHTLPSRLYTIRGKPASGKRDGLSRGPIEKVQGGSL